MWLQAASFLFHDVHHMEEVASASAVAAGLIPFIPGTGSGKKDHITVWETDDTIYSVTNDTAIANKDFT